MRDPLARAMVGGRLINGTVWRFNVYRVGGHHLGRDGYLLRIMSAFGLAYLGPSEVRATSEAT